MTTHSLGLVCTVLHQFGETSLTGSETLEREREISANIKVRAEVLFKNLLCYDGQ